MITQSKPEVRELVASLRSELLLKSETEFSELQSCASISCVFNHYIEFILTVNDLRLSCPKLSIDNKMLSLLRIGAFTILWLPLAAVALYALALTIYRLVLSPLAKFPGPKLAALTRKYESYYEAVQNYEYLWKIKEWHQKYGRAI